MAYSTLYTANGLRLLAAAEANGTSVKFVTMAVGDGAGAPVTPGQGQTGLVRETYRANINRVYQDPSNAARFTAELIIPASVGGFVIREAGVYDANGTLLISASLPDTYKPTASEGAFSDVVVAIDFFASNASVINLNFDPNTVVVTQNWITNNVTAKQIIPGGTVGQFLGKATNTDGDYEWQDPTMASVRVDTVAEKQVLAANQTTINLTLTTVYGLAVYVGSPDGGGERLFKGSGANEWNEVPNNPTQITLGKAYPAGYIFQGVNNEPAGSAPAPLERDKNGSDVLDKAAFRTNLEVYSKAEVMALGAQWAPVGQQAYFHTVSSPLGWLRENGAAVSRVTYAALFAVIGTRYGAGDGFNTFNLPDSRGEFIRALDDGRGIDAGRVLGSFQAQAIQSHNHTGTTDQGGNHNHAARTADAGQHGHSFSGTTGVAGNHGHNAWTDAQGAHNHPYQMCGSDDYAGGRSANGNGGFESWGYTEVAGNHGHNVGIGASGDHQHGFSGSTGQAGNHSHSVTVDNAGIHSHTFTTSNTGGTETRPRNIALLSCIKY